MKIARVAKYGLFPGDVVSKNDGDIHYITAPRLAQCYGIDFGDCIVYSVNDTREDAERDGLIPLFPDPTGEYRLPCRAKQASAWFNNYKESEHGRILGVVPR